MNDRFGSTARDFAAGIVTREGGTPEDVRELSYGRGRVCQDTFCGFSKLNDLSVKKSPKTSCLQMS